MNLRAIESHPAVRKAGIEVLKVHQFVYERSGGRVGHWFFGSHLLLHTVGAKTGERRVNALTYARDGESYVVVASMGGAPRNPGWYHNLRAHPDVEIQVGTTRHRVHARVVLPGDPDRERLWQLADRSNAGRYTQYQKATTRPIPVVVLEPR